MNLNEQQLSAVTHGDGPLLILAGAGSGKTRVLTSRIAHLIMNKGLSPDQILAVTFTNKAAGEMKDRVEKLTGIPPQMMWVSTFHSFCLRVLRRFASKIGYKEGFLVFDSADQTALIRTCLKELNISEKMVTPSGAVSKISRLKDDYVTSEIFEAESTDYWSQRFAPIYNLYQMKLKMQNAMDFGDLLMKTLDLFESCPDILSYFQNMFRHILVDEYQDTNHVQYRLIRSLSEKYGNIFVVGDEDQSIYRWRGADIRNILEFQKDFPGARVIKLEQNYRSTPTILSAANSVIRNNERRLGKNLWSDLPDQEKVTVSQKMLDLEEAKHVADKLQQLVLQDYRYDDAAIFYRTNAQSRVFEECFRNYGIPYVIYGGIKFYERKEIKDIIAYLQYVLEPGSDVALSRIINVPARGIGKTTVDKIKDSARENGSTMNDALRHLLETNAFRSGTHKKLKAFEDIIHDVRVKLEELALGDLTSLLLETTGYLSSYKFSEELDAADRIENIHEFLRATYEFKDVAGVSLPQFLDQVALVSDLDNMDSGKGAVPLMTVHLAKGLEFPHVFMVGMEEGLFPHARSMDDEEELEEERRLCYVGMTRAKDKLHMSYCSRRRLFGREQYNLPSRFIDEIDEKFIDREFVDIWGSGSGTIRPELVEGRASATEQSPEPMYEYEDFDQRPEDERTGGLRVGLRVRHPVFGEGIIQKVEGPAGNQKVMIRFKNGQLKTIVVKYAQLEIISS